MQDKNTRGYTRIIYIGLVAALIFLLIATISQREFYRIESASQSYNIMINEFEAIYDDGSVHDIKIDDTFNYEGETLTLKALIPASYSEGEAPTLVMRSYYAYMTVRYGDRILFDSAEEHRDGFSIGCYELNLPLGHAHTELMLEVEMEFPIADSVVAKLEPYKIVNGVTYHEDLRSENQLKLAIMWAEFLIGIVLLIAYVIFLRSKYAAPMQRLLPISMLALFFAAYSFASGAHIIYNVEVTTLMYWIEMVSFMLAVIPFMIYCNHATRHKHDKAICVVELIAVLNAVVQILLHFGGFVEFRKMLSMTHAVQVIGMIVCIVALIREWRINTKYVASLLPVAIGGLIDLGIYFASGHKYQDVYFYQVAALIFLGLNIWFAILEAVQLSREDAEIETYRKMAMEDAMTGCMSRGAYELLAQRSSVSDFETAFIMLDVNDLKETNDTYGHDAGDRLLKSFSSCLLRTMSGHGTVYRLGGDEFCVITHEASEKQVNYLVDKFSQAITELNKTLPPERRISFACGTSRQNGRNISLHLLSEEADKRMYKNKRIMKGLAVT